MIRDLAVKSRSYRGYDESRRISREELLGFVDAARFAPSSINKQPFVYMLAWKKEDVDRIQPLTGWARGLPDRKLPHPGKCPTAFIVICQDTEVWEDLNRFQKDVGAVAQTMLLAAVETGLGGIMINNFNRGRVSEELHLPDNLVPMLIVAFGKPDETIILTEAAPGESVQYYRDENDVHYVPKRRLEDIVRDV
ncbi:MAG: nitroreductase family protein [Lachnospiraceae bacterium]|nr:nitroreductase family protein [Lachnospiraceae bacterium]